MKVSVSMVAAPFLRSLKAYSEKSRAAVVKAINVSAVNYHDGVTVAMRTTPRMAALIGSISPVVARAVSKAEKPGAKKKKRRRSGSIHVPSKVGSPPAVDTGRLVNSVKIDFAKATKGSKYEPAAAVGTNVIYARKLESLKGLNRPVWRPIWRRQISAIRKRIADAQNGKT